MKIIVNSEKALYDHIEYVRNEYKKHKHLRIDIKSGKQRTNSQNAALHLYCERIAAELRNRGISHQKFFKEGFEVPWTMEIVKDNVWKPVQIWQTKYKSTTEPLASDYEKIFDIVNRKLSEWGLHIPWPTKK